jgi:hypothetical protein
MDVNWTELAEDRVQYRDFVNAMMNRRVLLNQGISGPAEYLSIAFSRKVFGHGFVSFLAYLMTISQNTDYTECFKNTLRFVISYNYLTMY